MRKLTISSLPVILSVIIILSASLNVNAKNKRVRVKDLIGTWQICNPDSTDANNVGGIEGHIRYKIITSETFMVADISKDQNKMLGTFWGTYSLEKNIYSEYIQYTSSDWRNIFGAKNSFKVYLKDDLLFIKGTNNPYNEIWVKIND